MKKRISRNDVIFLAILLAVVTVFLVVYERTGTRADAGACVRVTVDGSVYGTYALGEEQEIPIVQDGVTTNVLTIRDGRADMTEADCPDKLCVHQKAISKKHEMIVCLPNKVVVEVTGSEENGFDSIARSGGVSRGFSCACLNLQLCGIPDPVLFRNTGGKVGAHQYCGGTDAVLCRH